MLKSLRRDSEIESDTIVRYPIAQLKKVRLGKTKMDRIRNVVISGYRQQSRVNIVLNEELFITYFFKDEQV